MLYKVFKNNATNGIYSFLITNLQLGHLIVPFANKLIAQSSDILQPQHPNKNHSDDELKQIRQSSYCF